MITEEITGNSPWSSAKPGQIGAGSIGINLSLTLGLFPHSLLEIGDQIIRVLDAG